MIYIGKWCTLGNGVHWERYYDGSLDDAEEHYRTEMATGRKNEGLKIVESWIRKI
jgi:hypothetical protein